MNTDIRIACTWPTHPKTKKLIRRIGADGAFSLLALWAFAAQYHPKGTLKRMDAEDIALAASWDNEPKDFVSALLDVGFLDEGEAGVYSLHDWADHQPYVVHAEARSQRSRAAANARWGKAEDADRMPSACRPHAASMLTVCRMSKTAMPLLLLLLLFLFQKKR